MLIAKYLRKIGIIKKKINFIVLFLDQILLFRDPLFYILIFFNSIIIFKELVVNKILYIIPYLNNHFKFNICILSFNVRIRPNFKLHRLNHITWFYSHMLLQNDFRMEYLTSKNTFIIVSTNSTTCIVCMQSQNMFSKTNSLSSNEWTVGTKYAFFNTMNCSQVNSRSME